MAIPRFLVVDDEEYIREVLKSFFTRTGYEVMTAENGEDALVKLRQYKFDCIISDLKMPDMDGLELLKVVKEQDPGIIFFLITGYPTIDDAVEVMKQGAYDFIVKPFQLDDIKIKVERALYAKGLEKSLRKTSGIMWAIIISIPIWLILGTIFGLVWKKM